MTDHGRLLGQRHVRERDERQQHLRRLIAAERTLE